MFDCLFALIFFFIVGADDGVGVIIAVDSSFNELQCW